MIELNNVQLVYGLYDITPEEGDYISKKFGFRDLDDAMLNWSIKPNGLYTGYHNLSIANGNECLIFGYLLEMDVETPINNLLSDTLKNQLLQYQTEMHDKGLLSPFLRNGIGYVMLTDMPQY